MSVVYFVRAGATGPIKIGTAADLPRRMESLQCGCPEMLVVLATIAGGRKIEARYHRLLRDDRYRGEWFKPSAAVLAAVAAAREGRVPHVEPEGGHAQIVHRIGIAQIAARTGLTEHTVRSWGQRNNIPAEHWHAFIEIGAATLEELAAGVKPRKPVERAAAA